MRATIGKRKPDTGGVETMPAKRKLPGPRELKGYVDRGWTQERIAEHISRTTGVHVTRGAVAAALSRAGLTGDYKRHGDVIPWKLAREHQGLYPAQMLRNAHRIDRGETVSPDTYEKVQRWKRRLTELDAVVHYDPVRGFNLVKRPPGCTGWTYPVEEQQEQAAG